jgi:hypothetical protein
MRSVRTNISFLQRDMFIEYIKSQGLDSIMVGDYADSTYWRKLSYAYSEKDTIAEQLVYIKLKHGSLESAYAGRKTITPGDT